MPTRYAVRIELSFSKRVLVFPSWSCFFNFFSNIVKTAIVFLEIVVVIKIPYMAVFLDFKLTTAVGLHFYCTQVLRKKCAVFTVLPRKNCPEIAKLNSLVSARLGEHAISTNHQIRLKYVSSDGVHLIPSGYFLLTQIINNVIHKFESDLL